MPDESVTRDKARQYFDALKIIASAYMTPDQLRKKCQRMYCLDYDEAIEYAYENMMECARLAIKGHRRP